jgi:DNA-binding MarR family transcriptional regulator
MDPRIGYLLKRVQTGLRNGMDGVLKEKGLTTPQYAALSALEAEPGISNAELARRSFVTPQTMIRIVENLEGMGLIERTPHPSHGRVLTARLTRDGKRLVAASHAGVNAVVAGMLRDLNAKEQSALQSMLQRCAEALESSG